MKKYLSIFYRVLFFSLSGIFILGQFGRFELGTSRAVYFQDIVLALMGIVFIATNLEKVKLALLHTHLGKIFVIANGWIFFTSLFHFHDDISQLSSAVLYLLRLDVIVLFGLEMHFLLRKRVFAYMEIENWILTAITGIAIAGWVQYLFVPDTRGLKLLGWDDHYYRLISTIFDPGFTGIILVIGTFFVLLKFLKSKKASLAACYILLSTALLFTYSRASYLAFGIGILFLAWKLKRYLLLVLLPIFAIGVVLLPRPGGEGVKLERTASIVSRVDSIDSSFTNFGIKELLLGKGWYWKKEIEPTSVVEGSVVPNHSSAAENSYVFVLTSLGVVGVLLFGGALYLLLKESQWSVEVSVIFLAVGVHALFTNTWFYPFVLILLAVIMAGNGESDLEKSR